MYSSLLYASVKPCLIACDGGADGRESAALLLTGLLGVLTGSDCGGEEVAMLALLEGLLLCAALAISEPWLSGRLLPSSVKAPFGSSSSSESFVACQRCA
jgi:hypothetical protein